MQRQTLVGFLLMVLLLSGMQKLYASSKSRSFPTITFFQTETDKAGWQGVIRGRVVSLGSREIADKELRQLAQEKTKVTVRMESRDGIIPGDTLFVINERNLIVSKLKVVSVIKSKSFGYLLVGYGNFRRVQKEFYVVQRRDQDLSRYAWVHKARGDFHKKNRDFAKAIVEYERAIKRDSSMPEAHLELAYLYLAKGIHEYALKEFDLAYQMRGFIYDKEDLYRLYRGLLELRSYNAYESPVIDRVHRNNNIAEGAKVAAEALSEFPGDADFLYTYGLFHYDCEEPQDILVKEYMVKVIAASPRHIQALVILAELYEKHDNDDKALGYAERALSIDPTNERARNIYFKLTR